MKALFFTDVDGTLIDHNDYSYGGSLRGIELLRESSVPLVAVSSKTYEEMSLLLRELGLYYPFAFENGSGIAYPEGRDGSFRLELNGPGSESLAEFLPEIEKFSGRKLKAITSLSENELAELTGLNIKTAALAKKRKTTLPFIADGDMLLSDSDIQKLNGVLKGRNVHLTKGGRFNHLIPADSGKGKAVKKIIEFYSDKFTDDIRTAAAGDSMNDIPMFEAVDFSYVIRKPGGNFIHYAEGKVMDSAGPAGFSEAAADYIKVLAG